ncbi:MAG: hypothetical protein ACAI37_14135 [Chthoniobacter sp.]
MPHDEFRPGFRFSFRDAIVLGLGAFGTWHLWPESWLLAFVIAFVVGHFFLFCNVFRISRGLELCWAAVFVTATALTLKSTHPVWAAIALPTLVTTAVVIGIELRRPSYHGIGWQRINPDLREWWNLHQRS